MKKSIYTAVILMLFLVTFSSCDYANSKEAKLDNAKDDVKEAKANLDVAKEEYLANVEAYRMESQKKIDANNKSIADFKTRIAREKMSVKSEYEKQIIALDNKNNDMKKRMDDYKAESIESWESFKTEFGNDMNDLENSLKNFTKDNSK